MGDRLLRINEAMREVLSEAIAELSDPRLGFVTVTGVQAQRDLKAAKVFISVLGDEAARAQTMKALNSSQGLLQRAVAREVKLRNTPQLQFTYDDTTDVAMRLEQLLRDTSPDD